MIAKLLGDAKLPAIFAFTESVEAGGLMAYSFDLIELHKRAANNIDAILRGAKAGNIPIYQVTKFELSVNLKTAKQLGLSVPHALIASRRNEKPGITAGRIANKTSGSNREYSSTRESRRHLDLSP